MRLHPVTASRSHGGTHVRSKVVTFLPFLLISASLVSCAGQSSTDAKCLESSAKSCAGADLTDVDLTGGAFDGWNFSGADLTGANLTDGRFKGANFDRARLDKASASGADFTEASFFGSNMVGIDLHNANLFNADLEGPDLRNADLQSVKAEGIRLHEVNFTGADLTDADLNGALFARVYLGDAKLENADLGNTVFVGTVLDASRIAGATFGGALLRGEDSIPTLDELPGATICRSKSCESSPSAPQVDANASADLTVPAEAFTFGAFNAARFGSSYGESPVAVSRGLALSYLAAFGLYPDSVNRDVLLWEPAPPVDVPSGVRDVAALYATANTAIALRQSPKGDAFDGRMRGLILARDVTLWELTRDAPELRTLVARLAVESSALVLQRAASDGFAERDTKDTGVGAWEQTPPAFVKALEPNWGKLTRFLEASNDCNPPAPSSDPVKAAQETRVLADEATKDQRDAARFWDDERIRTTTPTGHWTFIASQALGERIASGELSPAEAFKVMSAMTIAMADSLSEVWEAKFLYRTARPITIINREDPKWRSYLTNPPFPAYPSGHAAISRAAAEVLTAALGSVPFTSDGGTESSGANRVLNIQPRSFASFDAAATEAGMSRLWGGIHVMEDFDAAVGIGRCVADLLR